jgi:hypothetical protein
MRKIKFRVWDKVIGKMFTPQAISFDIQKSVPFAISVPGRSWEHIGKFELLQWTGFSDQNGVDVYEGDFIKISSVFYIVIWNETQATFELIELGSSSKGKINSVLNGSVIGNQFQDPGLCPVNHFLKSS